MAKRTYIATSKISGLEPPKKDKEGNVLGEHTLEVGDAYDMDEAAAKPFVDGGSLVLKGSPEAPTPAPAPAKKEEK
jgi:hypothetical protein